MARAFTKNTSNYMSLGNSGLNNVIGSASAFSFHMLIKAASLDVGADDNNLLFEWTGLGTTGFNVNISGASSLLRVRCRSQAADSLQSKSSTTSVTTGAWFGCGGVIDVGGDTITPYLNGAAEGGGAVTFGAATYSNSGEASPAAIGANTLAPPSTAVQFDGDIAEVALWTAALTADDFVALNKGFSPQLIRPDALTLYMPFIGRISPEISLVGSTTGTITGTIAASAHPRVIYPKRKAAT